MKRFLWLGFVLFLYVICSGCGDTFRPIIIPNPPVFPNPQASHSVLSVNDNGIYAAGSGMVIDVSGDTDVSTVDTGIGPVHAAQQTASQVLVVSQAVTGYDPPVLGGCLIVQPNPEPVLNVCPSITKLTYSGTVISSTSTITLPASSAASFSREVTRLPFAAPPTAPPVVSSHRQIAAPSLPAFSVAAPAECELRRGRATSLSVRRFLRALALGIHPLLWTES